MAQHTDIVLPSPSAFTRQHFAALRAYCQNVSLSKIQDLYFAEDDPAVAIGLERFLLRMRRELIERAIDANPKLARGLEKLRANQALLQKGYADTEDTERIREKRYVHAGTLSLLFQVAEMPVAAPRLEHPLSQWFRPQLARQLKNDGLRTVNDLKRTIERRGRSWWRPIARIGAGRARVVEAWLRTHEPTLGSLQWDDSPLSPARALTILDPRHPDRLVPLECMALNTELDGSRGMNRSPLFAFIQARHDLEAVQAYLLRFREQPHTLRAYTKELERLILWAVIVAKRPLSSLLASDIESYKGFLKAPGAAFCGPRAPRTSIRWKPFSETPLSSKSQAYAFQVIAAFFEWLVKVRYLAGNPCHAVRPPRTEQEIMPMQIGRALPTALWRRFIAAAEQLCAPASAIQERIGFTAVLLMGDSGIRRAEVASVRRSALVRSPYNDNVHVLTVLGKRNKLRQVPVSARVVNALRSHWQDRGLDFDSHTLDGRDPFLLAPLFIPNTPAAQARHMAGEAGYAVDAIGRLVQALINRLQTTLPDAFTTDEWLRVHQLSAHAFRHTFATAFLENKRALDVLQKVLGHASIQTTSLYLSEDAKRLAEESAKFYEGLSDSISATTM